MKKTTVVILMIACALLAAVLCGIYIGRNLTRNKIQISALTTQPATQTATQVASSLAAGQSDGKININTADLETLTKLAGIGEIYAQRIIDYRNANGPFYKIEDIMKVEGIGAKRYEDIKNFITTGG